MYFLGLLYKLAGKHITFSIFSLLFLRITLGVELIKKRIGKPSFSKIIFNAKFEFVTSAVIILQVS